MPAPPDFAWSRYGDLLHSADYWQQWAQEALRRSGMRATADWEVGTVGSHPTLLSDTGIVVKLFTDRFGGAHSYPIEVEAAELCGRIDVPVPELLAHGELYPDEPGWRWPFTITRRLSGLPFAAVRADLPGTSAVRVATQLGRHVRRLHDAGPAAVPHARSQQDFAAILRRRRDELRAAAHREQAWNGLPADLVQRLEATVPAVADLLGPGTFVHADLHEDHVFVDPETARVTGIIDFGDAFVADPRYELIALHLGCFGRRSDLLSTFLAAYGERPAAVDLLAFCLLHEFDVVGDAVGEKGLPDAVRDPESLAAWLWEGA